MTGIDFHWNSCGFFTFYMWNTAEEPLARGIWSVGYLPGYLPGHYCLHHNQVCAVTSGEERILDLEAVSSVASLLDYVISIVLCTYNRNIVCANSFPGLIGCRLFIAS